jgi:hypothetical protein
MESSGYLPIAEHGLIGDPGNVPQVLTHLALISAAFNLDRALEPGRTT